MISSTHTQGRDIIRLCTPCLSLAKTVSPMLYFLTKVTYSSNSTLQVCVRLVFVWSSTLISLVRTCANADHVMLSLTNICSRPAVVPIRLYFISHLGLCLQIKNARDLIVERYGQPVSYKRITHRCTVLCICNGSSCLVWIICGLNPVL
jgi:hypothetical protein